MNSYKREKSKSALEEKERKDKQERLWQVRQQWYIAQEKERQHEARKSKMIEEYERNRAQALKIHQKHRVLQPSKSNSPQRRTTDYKYPEELKMSSSEYQKNTIIDEKELHRIKIDVYKKKDHRTRSQDTSKNKIERNIDPDDIVLPRRKNEGLRPIFEKRKTAQDEMQRIRFVQDNKLVPEKQLSDEESSDTWESTSINTYKTNTQYSNSRSHRSIGRRYDQFRRTDNQYRSDRNRSSSPSNRAKKGKKDFGENKFSSRRNRSREPDDRVSLSQASSYIPSYSFYDMRFPGSMPMYRIQAPPMIWPIAPMFPAPFPPGMSRWQPYPLRFANYNVGRGFYRGPR
ncbi:hypothetical protein ACS0PU_009705 [Formica fusca]